MTEIDFLTSDEAAADLAIGTAVLKDRFFQKPPSEERKRAAGRTWFEDNKDAIRTWCKEHPQIAQILKGKSERRNDILAMLGDVVLFGSIGIPVLSLLVKIAHYGYDKLMAENPDA